jgi:hypothetical protein
MITYKLSDLILKATLIFKEHGDGEVFFIVNEDGVDLAFVPQKTGEEDWIMNLEKEFLGDNGA